MSYWSDGIHFVTLCFCIFTAVLTASVFLWSRRHNSPMLTTFDKRMATLWVIIALFVLAFVGGKIINCLFFAAISVLGSREYNAMIMQRHQFETRNPTIYLFILLQYSALYCGNDFAFCALLPLSVFILVPFAGMLNRKASDVGLKSLLDYIGLMLTVYALSYMCAFLNLTLSDETDGAALLLFVLILTLMSDFFQAICGYLCGKHYIVPTLSPHKTLEGLLGGGILTGILAWIMGRYLTPFAAVELFILGFVLNFAAFCGDVTVSAIKRYAGVKDSGNLLPGHGGLLDRFDSIMFTAPVLFWYVLCCY